MKKFISIALVLFSSAGYTLQHKTVTEGDMVHALIAQKDLTRIYVKSDRIKDIKSASNEFTLEKDEDNGQIFIMPSPDKNEAIILYLTTELGKTITLSLKPAQMPPETLELAMKPVSTKMDKNKALSYEATIFQLVKAMHKRKPIPGYSVEDIPDNKIAVNGLESREVIKYEGKYTGKVLEIKNKTDVLVRLDEDELKDLNIKAISIAKRDLMPNETTEIYLIYGV